MADISSAPPPRSAPPLPAAPAPGPAGPSSASITGGAMDAGLALNAAKGAGGAGGGGGGNGGDSNKDGAQAEDTDEGSSLGRDRTGSGLMTALPLHQMTFQAAFSQLRKSGEVTAPTPSDLTALKKALKEHSDAFEGSPGKSIAATEAVLEHLAELDAELGTEFHIDPDAQLNDLHSSAFSSSFDQDAADPEETTGVRFRDRGRLRAARSFESVQIPAELHPTSEGESARIETLIRDPRAGFAPEGLAAWDLERATGVVLASATTERNDFVAADGSASWSVISLLPGDTNFIDLTRFAKEADGIKSHVIVDANAVTPTPLLVNALRVTSTKFPKVRVHLSIQSQG